jgi:O-antigen ligase
MTAMPKIFGLDLSLPEEPLYIPPPAPNDEEAGGKDRWCRKIIEYGLLGLIVFTPLPIASVDDWAILLIELVAVFLTAVYFLMGNKPHVNGRLLQRLPWPRYAFAALFVLFLPFQLIPIPKSILRLFSPHAYALQQQYSPRFAEMKSISLSLVPSQTLREGLLILAYVLIGFLVVRVITRRAQMRRMMMVMVGMGVFEAFFGLFELYQKSPSLLFYRKSHNLDSVTGTFVNRNHFSGYLELIIPIALTLVISRIDLFTMPGKKWRQRLAVLTGKGTSINILLGIGITVMALGILLSNSRSGGVLLLVIFMLFFELIVFYFSRSRLRKIWIKNFIKIMFIVVTLIALYVGIEAMVGRFSLDNLLQDGRPRYWTTVMRIVKDFPFLGTGLGTFGLAYEAYETLGLSGMLVHAHNDYLEYLSELGILGFALLASGILFITADSFLTWAKRRNAEVKSLALGGLVSVFVMLAHSLTDFNMHIPANALLFTMILSLTWSAVYYRKS